MTQRPEPGRRSLSGLSGPWLWAAAGIALVLVVVVVLLVRGGSGDDDADGDSGGPGTAGGEPTSLPSTDGFGSPVVTPSPGQTAPGVAKTPTATPRPVRARLGEPAKLDRGVEVQVVKHESVKGVARGAGERAGPAVRFTVELTNGTSKELDLRAVTVTAYVGPKRIPANELSGPGTKPFPQSVAAGKTATGILVFRMVPKDRDDVRLDVSYRGESPTAIFTGSVR